MSEPLDLARPAAAIGAEPWTERGIEPVGAVERLSPEQPESGLLWVLTGAVIVTRSGRAHEISKGSVASYRLGGGLTWSAKEATRVRWNARAVRLEPGRVAPWTADLALEIPANDAPPAKPRRKTFALMAIALSWMVALTVAWCYDQAKSASLSPTTGMLGALPVMTADQRGLADQVSSAFDAAGLPASRATFPAGRSAKMLLYVRADPSDVDSLRARIGDVAKGVFDRHTGLQLLRIRLSGSDEEDWGEAISLRKSVVPTIDVYHNQGRALNAERRGAPESGAPHIPMELESKPR